MPVRGSPNYVWFTEQSLGSGATGNVYFGRHKRMGDACAVKVFADLVRTSHIQAKARELELMRKLNHRNIVKLLAIEQESHTKENVLIMELCSEGSVYDLLCRPENAHGFPEIQFVDFFRDFVYGVEYLRLHGIIHRDIKPGNILCSKLDDGRYAKLCRNTQYM
jgi:TANK-binding kinase 1